MPHSLRVKVKKLRHQGIITDKECERLITALDIKDELDNIKYWVCCPMCDNEKCVKGTDACEAEQWIKNKENK